MNYPKTWHQQQDEVAAAIDRLLRRRRRDRIVRKIQQVAKSHRPGEGRVMLRRISQYLRNANDHI